MKVNIPKIEKGSINMGDIIWDEGFVYAYTDDTKDLLVGMIVKDSIQGDYALLKNSIIDTTSMTWYHEFAELLYTLQNVYPNLYLDYVE